MRRVCFAAVHQELQQDDGGARRDEKSKENAARERVSAPEGETGGDRDHPEELDRAGDCDDPAQAPDARQREVEPDGEEKKNDPDLGEGLDHVHVADERQAVGTDEDARSQKSHERRLAQALDEPRRGKRREQDERDRSQEGRARHAATVQEGCSPFPSPLARGEDQGEGPAPSLVRTLGNAKSHVWTGSRRP